MSTQGVKERPTTDPDERQRSQVGVQDRNTEIVLYRRRRSFGRRS